MIDLIKVLGVAIVFCALAACLSIFELWALKKVGFDAIANLSAEILGIKIAATGAIALLIFQPMLLFYIAMQMAKLLLLGV